MNDKITFSSSVPTMYMMQGLPGSGKTTAANALAENYDGEIHVHSSDAIRKELFGDESVQDKPQMVFNELHKRIKNNLRNGISTIYDATNIDGKFRRAFLEELKMIPCRKVNMCIVTPYEDCLNFNKNRERVVPEYVIRDRYMHWQPPSYQEGFDEIKLSVTNSAYKYDIGSYMENALKFDQENSHHTMTLGEHGGAALKYLMKDANTFSYKQRYRLFAAALLHDCGKPFTKTRKNFKGEEDGDCHYYQHHCVGAYDSIMYCLNMGYPIDDIFCVSNLIYYHMHPYTSWKQSEKAKERDQKLLGDEMFNDILRLHEADVAAH